MKNSLYDYIVTKFIENYYAKKKIQEQHKKDTRRVMARVQKNKSRKIHR